MSVSPLRGTPRIPPHDEQAEQALLGAMLTTREAREAGLELTSEAFLLPFHAKVHQAIARAHDESPAGVDVVTVAAHLGGTTAPLLALVAAAPMSGHAGHYAQIVARHARLRSVIEYADLLSEAGWNQADDQIDQLLASAEVRLSGPNRVEAETVELLDLFEQPAPIPKPWVIPGLLRAGENLVLTGGEGAGKMECDITLPVLTKSGWTTVGELTPGERIFDLRGAPTTVLAVHPIWHGRPTWRVHFSDGSSVLAGGSHLWLTHDYRTRLREAQQKKRGETKPKGTDQRHKRTAFPSVVSTDEIRATLWARNGHCLNHAIPVAGELETPEVELPIDPYLLGIWLGDGDTAGGSFATADQEIVDAFKLGGYQPRKVKQPYRWGTRGLATKLRSLGVLGHKHVPESYLMAGTEQRWALLAGLLDSDGCAARGARVEFTVTKERLAEGFVALARTLGVQPTVSKETARLNGVEIGPKWRVTFSCHRQPFRLPRKAERWSAPKTQRPFYRYITAVTAAPSIPMRCITVDSPDGTWLVGSELIPTHNTLLRQLALGAAAGVHPFTELPMERTQVLIVDLQEDETELREELWKQHRHVAKHYRRGMIQTVTRRAGVDLLTAHDARWFEALLTRIRPGLVIMGPLKKLYKAPAGKGIWDDDVVEALHRRFDEWQTRFGFAMCLEGHAGHDRETWRVKGSSAWYAWPHFGYGMNPVSWKPREVEMKRWRGDRENGVVRHWPSHLVESPGWAWGANRSAVEELRKAQQAGDPVETMEAFDPSETF